MTLLLIAVSVLHLLVLILLFIATLDKKWFVSTSDEVIDIWLNCYNTNNTDTWICKNTSENEWLHAVQALMMLSVFFASAAFLVFLCQLYAMQRGGLFYTTGIFQIFSDLLVSVYQDLCHPADYTTTRVSRVPALTWRHRKRRVQMDGHCLTVFSAALIYSIHSPEIVNSTRGRYGYCFYIAWMCCPLLLVSGSMYIHLRKKK